MFVFWHFQSIVYYQAIQQYLIIVIPLFFCLNRGCQFDKTVAKSHWGLTKLLQCQNTMMNSSVRLPALPCRCRQDLWHSMFPLPGVSQVLLQISTPVPFTMFLLHPRREERGAVILVRGKEVSATHYTGNNSVHDKENASIGLGRSGFPSPFPEQRTTNLPGQVWPLAVSDQQIMEWEETWLI